MCRWMAYREIHGQTRTTCGFGVLCVYVCHAHMVCVEHWPAVLLGISGVYTCQPGSARARSEGVHPAVALLRRAVAVGGVWHLQHGMAGAGPGVYASITSLSAGVGTRCTPVALWVLCVMCVCVEEWVTSSHCKTSLLTYCLCCVCAYTCLQGGVGVHDRWRQLPGAGDTGSMGQQEPTTKTGGAPTAAGVQQLLISRTQPALQST